MIRKILLVLFLIAISFIIIFFIYKMYQLKKLEKMSSGEVIDFITKDEILNKVKTITLEDKDYKFNYSNFGISVIGLILEEVYNRDFVTLMKK